MEKQFRKEKARILGLWLVKVLDLGVIIFVVARRKWWSFSSLLEREKMEGKEVEDSGYFDKLSTTCQMSNLFYSSEFYQRAMGI